MAKKATQIIHLVSTHTPSREARQVGTIQVWWHLSRPPFFRSGIAMLLKVAECRKGHRSIIGSESRLKRPMASHMLRAGRAVWSPTFMCDAKKSRTVRVICLIVRVLWNESTRMMSSTLTPIETFMSHPRKPPRRELDNNSFSISCYFLSNNAESSIALVTAHPLLISCEVQETK